MADIDASIPLSYKQDNIVNTLGNIVNTQRGMVALQRERATLPTDILQSQAQSETAQQVAQQQHLATMRAQVSNAAQDILSLHGTGMTPEDLKQHIVDKMTNAGAKPDAINKMTADVPEKLEYDKYGVSNIDKFIVGKAQSVLSMPEQMASKFPAPTMVQTGQKLTPVATANPALTGVQPGTQQGEGVQMELPPTTPTMVGGVQGYVGVMPEQKPGFIQSGPGMGQTQAVGGTVDVINKDWADTQSQAANASRDIGVLQNIKQLAPGAITGVGADRKQFLAGLAGSLDMSVEQMEKTSTDLLAKNANMLGLTGGNTDAARALAEAANPNIHMTPEAIQHAADQVIAQRKLAVIKQNFLAQHKLQADQNPKDMGRSYTQALQQFNKIADPRVLQLPTMSEADQRAMIKAMPPAEQKEFIKKVQAAQHLGWIQ